ncbi:phage tail tape measure protein [Rummeliibacillus stabekisii]|uniref:Phage tail tape measure protein domain-containing protein n=1 Tax=Rummeliibacillus stabekisii TaxID=241244 RepID=A0A143HC28_9BACL|nr:phage tail tape measure protein [Rummeliibacillus stabekisii]AMW99308.1 hypothetical protein ATY39_07415 [Rummeliibacillus stabekisii]
MSSSNIFEFEFQLGGTITPEMKRAFEDAKRHMGGLENKSKISTKAIKVGAAAAATAFVAVGAAIGKAIKSASEYQDAMAQVQASTGVSTSEMKEMKEIVKNLYNENLGEDFNDLSEAVSAARQVTKLQGKELQAVTEQAVLYRDVFGEDVSESIKTADTMMKNFGISSTEAYNLLAQGAQEGLNKSDELLDSANEYAPYYKALGYSANEMFDSFKNGLQKGAFNLDKVGDAMKEFNIRAKDGSKASLEAFADLGLNGKELTQTFAKGGDGAKQAFKKVATAIGNVKDPAKQSQIAVSLFGTQAEDLEMKVITSMGNVKSEFDGTKKTMEKVKEVKFDTLGAGFKSIGRQLYTGLVLPLGDSFIPVLQKVSKFASTAIPKVSSTIKTTFKTVKEVISNVSNGLSSDKGFSNYLNVIKKFGSGVKSVISVVAPYVKQGLSGVISFVKSTIQKVKSFWDQDGQQIAQAVQNVFKGIKAVVGFVMPFVLMIVKSVWNNVKGVITGALNIIMGVVKVFASLFTGDFKGMWTGVKRIFFGAVTGIWNLFQLMFYGKLLKGIGIVAKSGMNIFKSMWTGIKGFFVNGVKTANDKIVSFAQALAKGFKSAKNNGIEIIKSLWTSTKAYFSKIVDGAKALPGKMGQGIKNNAKKALSGITSMGNDVLVGMGKIVNGVIKGLNWIGGKIGIDASIPMWSVPQYANGTQGHPGGLAVLGDGGGPELFRTPNGKVGVSPGTDTLMNLPKGTQVIPHRQTAQIMASIVPKYEVGTGVKNALNKGKEWVSSAYGTVKDSVSDTMDYLTSPKSAFKTIIEKFGVTDKIAGVKGYYSRIASGGLDFVKNGALKWLKEKIGDFGASMGNISGGASAWSNIIKRAAAVMKVNLSASELRGIIAQIHRESGGNAQITQSSAVVDVNTLNGNPAKGLLQYIPQTFAGYAVKGHKNIFNGYDQLLAFFNNSNWRHDLPYGKSGWGPSGSRRFEKGGDVNTDDTILVGENGPELLQNRKGSRIFNTNKTQSLLDNIKRFKENQSKTASTQPKVFQITYAPEIHAEGNSDLDFGKLMAILKSDYHRFKKEITLLLESAEHENTSVSFE